jgi:predicted RNA-binding Zn-ribbon protein involved in translation (DUF1610 family)
MTFTCDNCGWRGNSVEILRCPSPFCADDEIMACPKCRRQDGLRTCCDNPGCTKPVTMGTPTPYGYAMTCRFHQP